MTTATLPQAGCTQVWPSDQGQKYTRNASYLRISCARQLRSPRSTMCSASFAQGDWRPNSKSMCAMFPVQTALALWASCPFAYTQKQKMEQEQWPRCSLRVRKSDDQFLGGRPQAGQFGQSACKRFRRLPSSYMRAICSGGWVKRMREASLADPAHPPAYSRPAVTGKADRAGRDCRSTQGSSSAVQRAQPR